MQRSRYSFVLDLQSTETQIYLVASQGDTNREFNITFSDGGVPFSLDESDKVEIHIEGAGRTFADPCKVEKGGVSYPFTEATCALEGLHKCQLDLEGKSGNITSPSFALFVGPKKTLSDMA